MKSTRGLIIGLAAFGIALGACAATPPNPAPSPAPGELSMSWQAVPRASTGPLPNRTASDGTIGGRALKHSRMAYDPNSKRVILTGGDRPGIGDGNGQPSVYATADLETWQQLAPDCVAAGQLQPARPDNVIWAIDSKRNKAIIAPGFYFGLQKAQADCPGPTYQHTALNFNLATDQWEAVPFPPPHPEWVGAWAGNQYGSDGNSTWGVYDPTSDSLLTYFWDGNRGAYMERLYLSTGKWTNTAVGYGFLRVDNDLQTSYAHRSQIALDEQGRAVYISTPRNRLFRYKLDVRNSGEAVPTSHAPKQCVTPNDSSQEIYMVFDSDHRAVLRICTPNLGGEVIGIAAYFVDTDTWVWYPAPVDQEHPVLANTFCYSPACRCVIGTGGHAILSQNPARPPGTMLNNSTVDWMIRLK